MDNIDWDTFLKLSWPCDVRHRQLESLDSLKQKPEACGHALIETH